MKKPTLLLVFACMCAGAWGQPVLSRGKAVADVDTLVSHIVQIHPDPFTVIAEREFMSAVEGVKGSMPDSISILDLYLKLAPLVADLGDGQTAIFTDTMHDRSLAGARYFHAPLSVDPTTLRLTSGGREVAQINGVSADSIVRTILRMESGEGVASRVFYAEWPLMVSLLWPAEKYAVVFSDGLSLEIAGTTYDRMAADVRWNYEKRYTYRIDTTKNAAILEFNSMIDKERFASFLDSMFTDIKRRGVDNLVIDLRKNSGGNSSLDDELFQYISSVPFQQYGKGVRRISGPLRRFHGEANLAKWEWPLKDTLFVEEGSLIELSENPLRFAGPGKRVFLLTSGVTYSSASNFAWAFRYFDMGTIVGDETGGYVVAFGEVFPLRLPNSGLGYSVSDAEYYGYGATEADRRPVRPDVAVPAAGALDHVLRKLVE